MRASPPADRPAPPAARSVDAALLAERPLPSHDPRESKQARGSVLVVGGSRLTPGAVVLAGIAALRAGAGKLRIATAASAAAAVAAAVPEALVLGVAETAEGAVDPADAAGVLRLAASSEAVLIGTGALDDDASGRLLAELVGAGVDATLVIDAGAIPIASRDPELIRALGGRGLAIPNPDEIACFGLDGDAAPGDAALAVAARLGCTVAVRGPDTWIADASGTLLVDRTGTAGLGTSGSGDVAAGLVCGLVARGADPVTAAAWAAHVHGRAGERLAATIAPLGFLARELLDVIPSVLAELGGTEVGPAAEA